MVSSRKELVSWFNGLGIRISRIEDLGKGTAICLLLSQLHPSFPSSFLKDPSNDYEYLKNMKIIQGFLIQEKIDFYFPVDRLVKCKLQDNLEVAQKLYKYYEKKKSIGGGCKDTVNFKDECSKDVVETKEECSKDNYDTLEGVNPREMRRLEIIQGLKKEEFVTSNNQSLQKENERLREELGQKELEILKFRNTLGELASSREILRALEENRDFYFKKLVEIEKYLEETEVPEKETLFGILYRKME